MPELANDLTEADFTLEGNTEIAFFNLITYSDIWTGDWKDWLLVSSLVLNIILGIKTQITQSYDFFQPSCSP